MYPQSCQKSFVGNIMAFSCHRHATRIGLAHVQNDDFSSDTTLSNLSRPSRNRVSISRNHVIADQWNKSPRKIAINAVSLFGHATHSAAVRSFP
jgi:hypothetical protein